MTENDSNMNDQAEKDILEFIEQVKEKGLVSSKTESS